MRSGTLCLIILLLTVKLSKCSDRYTGGADVAIEKSLVNTLYQFTRQQQLQSVSWEGLPAYSFLVISSIWRCVPDGPRREYQWASHRVSPAAPSPLLTISQCTLLIVLNQIRRTRLHQSVSPSNIPPPPSLHQSKPDTIQISVKISQQLLIISGKFCQHSMLYVILQQRELRLQFLVCICPKNNRPRTEGTKDGTLLQHAMSTVCPKTG